MAEKFAYVLAYLLGVIYVMLAAGWVLNIIELVGFSENMQTTEFVLRVVGIPVVILGGVMGYL